MLRTSWPGSRVRFFAMCCISRAGPGQLYKGSQYYERIFQPAGPFDHRQDAAQRRSTLPGETDGNVKGTSANLFMCSPHSCEVVKPVISRSFGHANQTSKRAARAALACPGITDEASAAGKVRSDSSHCAPPIESSRWDRTAWAALCGHCGGANFVD